MEPLKFRSPYNSPVIKGKSDEIEQIELDSFVEPILQENPTRFTLFPIMKPKLFQKYKNHISVFWTTEEIDLSKDMRDWVKLNANEQIFIKNVLGFFAGSDGIIQENLVCRFMNEIQLAEARQFYSVQLMMEAVHCVSPDTMILTDMGYFNIKSLAETKVNVWNGTEFSEVTVKKTSDSSRLYKVLLDNGMELDCTDEHKWLVHDKVEKIFTKNLKTGDIIGSFEYPLLDCKDPDEFKNPYTHGFFCGDGEYSDNYPIIILSNKELLQNLSISHSVSNQSTIVCFITINKEKYEVPINYSVETKLQWLKGLFDSRGSVEYTTVHYEFIKKVQLLLTTLGIRSRIQCIKDSCKKDHKCKPIYTLFVEDLEKIGFNSKCLEKKEFVRVASFVRVVSVTDTMVDSETYCFNEPKNHTGIFNGILTGQSETYSLLIDTYIDDKDEKMKLFKAIETIPCVKQKADWAQKWIASKDENFATRLIAFAVVEGIFFSGSFCAIYWIKERGLMPGLTTSNEFIARDEGLHTDFACALYEEIQRKLPKTKVHKIIREAVKIEKNFITKSLPCHLVGMNDKLMATYIEFVADRLSTQLGYGKIYNALNPFDFMERISLEGKDNFFEKRVTSYAKSGVGKNQEEMSFSLDTDF